MVKTRVDRKLVEHFADKYGPFSSQVIQNNKGHRCDFCGEAQAAMIVKARATETGKALFLCFTCEALPLLIGVSNADELEFRQWAVPNQGLPALQDQSDPPAYTTDQTEFIASEQEAKQIIEQFKASVVSASNDLPRVIEQVVAYQTAGIGKGWRIIPSLLRQYRERKLLTSKQVVVLLKYIRSCDRQEI